MLLLDVYNLFDVHCTGTRQVVSTQFMSDREGFGQRAKSWGIWVMISVFAGILGQPPLISRLRLDEPRPTHA